MPPAGEEFLQKLIRVVLLDHFFKEDSLSGLAKSASSSNLFQKKYEINPPFIRSISSISPQIRQTLQTLQSVLEEDPVAFQDRVQSEFISLTKDSFTKDMAMYQYFLEHNWVWENYSLNREAEMSFVQHHIQQNAGTGSLQQYCSSHPKKIAVWLRIIDAKGLLSKDLDGVNNPYCTVTFHGLTWVSPIRRNTINPVFEFNVSL
jgi:hypothetical protein